VSSIIIFGGSHGIGKAIAEYYISRGLEVSIGSRNLKALDKFRLAIARKKLNVNVIKVDITNAQDVAKAFKTHEADWGRSPDVVINCAAVQGPIGNSWSVPVKSWEETIKLNLCGSFIVARAAIEQMIKKGYGSIILFSGGGAAYGRPNFSAYGASKAGVLRMVETMAEELKSAGYPNIVINAVAPGAVKTRMTKEILKAGSKAGKKALEEAADVFKTGGTPSKKITRLIDFLIDLEANCGLTGRLIHVHEDYQWLIKEFGANVPDDIGKIRRIPIQAKR
jgi:3-oxoacyl-[acyl-carrier protein] reductase